MIEYYSGIREPGIPVIIFRARCSKHDKWVQIQGRDNKELTPEDDQRAVLRRLLSLQCQGPDCLTP